MANLDASKFSGFLLGRLLYQISEFSINLLGVLPVTALARALFTIVPVLDHGARGDIPSNSTSTEAAAKE
jgi:hypothetical protein